MSGKKLSTLFGNNTVYKITNENMESCSCFQWKLNSTICGFGNHYKKCHNMRSSLSFYHHPLIASMFYSCHKTALYDGDTTNVRLFEAILAPSSSSKNGIVVDEFDLGERYDDTSLTLIKEVNIIKITDFQRVVFGILCAKQVYQDQAWNTWADRWIDGTDHTETSVQRQIDATYYVSEQVRNAHWVVAPALNKPSSDGRIAYYATKYASFFGRSHEDQLKFLVYEAFKRNQYIFTIDKIISLINKALDYC